MKQSISEILKKLSINELSPMQLSALNAISEDHNDVIILSPTGSGKTLAYQLPLTELVDSQSDSVQAIVIVPSRELALQSVNVLNSMGCGLRGYAAYGGRPTMDEHREIRKLQPQIIFATPGRLNDHLDKSNFDASLAKYLVIDEFDKCLEMGFIDEMHAILDKLPNLKRRALLSATDSDVIPSFVQMKDVVKIDYRHDEESERLYIYNVYSPDKDKLETLGRLALSFQGESAIVFVNYRESVERIDEYLRSLGFVTSAYHGGLDQQERERVLYRFINGSANILVSTDLASRGLDIPQAKNIVHYHMPATLSNYTHRVGRTARWDASGRAFFLLAPGETIADYIKEEVGETADYEIPSVLQRACQPVNTTLYIGKGKKDKISKGDIVGFLCKKGGLKNSEIGRIDVKDRYAYVAVPREKTNLVLRQIHGEKIKGIRTIIEPVR